MQIQTFLAVVSIFIKVVSAMGQTNLGDIISVPNMEYLMSIHAEDLSGKKSRWKKRRRPKQQLFYIQDSDSYIAPTDLQQEWLRGSEHSVSSFVRDLKAVESMRRNGDHILYTHFYFRDLRDELSEKLYPVSLCHSEIYGEGSTVSMQVVLTGSRGVSGGLNIDPLIKWKALTFNTDLEFEKFASTGMSIKCNIAKGEVGQLFLSRTRKLTYTPWSRNVVYDTQAKSFIDLDLPHDKWPEESRIIQSGIGEWVCATSSRAELQCHGVRGLSILEVLN